jgi:hypothetical protein
VGVTAWLAPAPPDRRPALPVAGGSPRQTRDRAPGACPAHGGDGGHAPPRLPWERRPGAAGPKGLRGYAVAHQRVTRWQDGLPDRPVWLVRQRPGGAALAAAYARSHASARPPGAPASGSAGGAGPWHQASQQAKPRGAWPLLKSVSMVAGTVLGG